MKLTSKLTNKSGQVINIEYYEQDPLTGLGDKIMQGVHAFCCIKSGDPETDGKLVLVKHPKSGWMPAGGGIEAGETYEEAVVREVAEETNMKVLSQELIGYQDIYEPDRTVRQTRSFCIVEPHGPFVADPDGEIQEIILINPEDYKQYFDWGHIGDHVMGRVIEMGKNISN